MCVTHLSDSTSMFLRVSETPDNAAVDAESRACAPPHSGWGALVQTAHGKKKGYFPSTSWLYVKNAYKFSILLHNLCVYFHIKKVKVACQLNFLAVMFQIF